MPKVTITIEDATDGKSIDCDCNLDLYPGKPLSLAQIAAAEIMRRTNSVWCIKTAASEQPSHQVVKK